MDLMQLKLPPDKLPTIADALQRDIDRRPPDETADELHDVVVWLRYRHSKWVKDHPPVPQD